MKKILLFLLLFLPLKLLAQDVIVIDPGTFGGGIINIDPWISLDPLLDSVQNWIWVSKDNQTGRETGTYMLPYNTIAEGVADIIDGSMMIIVTPLDGSAYEITDPITIGYNNVVITGQGSSTIIDGDALLTTEHAFSITGKTGCVIQNLSVQTEDGGGKTSHCIFLDDGADGTIISNVTIIDSDSDGIHIEGTSTSGVVVTNCNILDVDNYGIFVDMDAANNMQGMQIIHNPITGAGDDGIKFGNTGSTHLFNIIQSNEIFSCTGQGIDLMEYSYGSCNDNTSASNTSHGIYVTTASNSTTVDGNIVYTNGAEGIQVNGSTDVIVSGNTCYDNTNCGIEFTGNAYRCTASGNTMRTNQYGIYVESSARASVTGNVTEGNSASGIFIDNSPSSVVVGNVSRNDDNSEGGGGIVVMDCDHVTVTGNSSSGSTYNGIYLYNADYCVVTGNIFNENTIDGIYLSNASTYNLISNNQCYGNTGDGIELAAAAEVGNIVLSNKLLDNVESDLEDNGVGTMLMHDTTELVWYLAPSVHVEDTLFFAYDSVYIIDEADSLRFVVDDIEAIRAVNVGALSHFYVYGDAIIADTLFFAYDSTYIVDSGDSLYFFVDDTEVMRMIEGGGGSEVIIYDTLNLASFATSTTVVLSPDATGDVDTLETIDLATADFATSGDWTNTGLWTFDTLIANIIDVDTLFANYADIDVVDVDSINVDTLVANYIYVDIMEADSIYVDTLISNYINVDIMDADSINADTLIVNYTDVIVLDADSIYVDTLIAEYIDVGVLDADSIYVDTLVSNYIYVDNMDADSISVDTLIANYIDVEVMDVDSINIDTLIVNYIGADTLIVDYIDVDNMDADSIKVDTLVAEYIYVDNMDADSIHTDTLIVNYINVDNMEADSINTDTLVANYAEIDNIDVDSINIDTLIVSYADIDILIVDSIDARYTDTDTLLVNDIATINLLVVDSADINYGDIDTLIADYSTMNIVTIDSADINYGDIDTLVADYVTFDLFIVDSIDANYVDTDTLLVNDLATMNLLVVDSIDANYTDTDTLLVNDLATMNLLIVDSVDANYINTDTLIANDTLYVGGMSMFDSTVSIGGWGYTGEHIILPEASSNTNPLLGIYGVVNYEASADKVFASTYSRLLVTANQTNSATMVGTESQFRLRDADIAAGDHAGIWAYAEQSGVSELSGTGTFDAISACVESGENFTVGANNHVTGITVDASINALATIDASANYSGLYIKSNGLDWFDGIKITGVDNDILLQNGATINNAETDTLILTETVVKVDGDLSITGQIVSEYECGFTYVSTPGQMTIATGGTFEKLYEDNIAYTGGHLYNFTESNGRLTYTGTATVHMTIICNVSIESDEVAQIVQLRIAENGTTIAGSNMTREFTTQNKDSCVGLNWLVELETNDYIEIFGTSDTDADQFQVNNLTLTVSRH